jgi:cell wall-associated NlpC family hydrolase
LGKKTLVVDGRKFNMDCSGVVMAVYYKSGIDLLSPLNQYSGGGVQRLYGLMDDNQLLYKQPHLAPGDILFWDNTYDSNDDGKINDPLTHIGMVVSTDSQGNVQYIHHNYRKGIVLAKMNLLDPDNLKMNSPMRARYAEKGHAPLWLSSHLLNQAAKGYLLTEN